jgi:hypothetical protein
MRAAQFHVLKLHALVQFHCTTFEFKLISHMNRPMGIVAGLVTKRDQPAGDIVREIVQEAYETLNSAQGYLRPSTKL